METDSHFTDEGLTFLWGGTAQCPRESKYRKTINICYVPVCVQFEGLAT